MFIKATTVSDAWFQALSHFTDDSVYKQNIERGSFEGGYRLQYPQLAMEIGLPLEDVVPSVPEGVASPATHEFITSYFHDYLLGCQLPCENEQYTYASRIGEQLDKVIGILAKTPHTNQATIEIGRKHDLDITDPACLRSLDFKVVGGKLSLTSSWRSNDMWAGFPVNIGGLGMLQSLVAEAADLEVGPQYYFSSGSHIYDYQIPFVEAKTNRKIIQ